MEIWFTLGLIAVAVVGLIFLIRVAKQQGRDEVRKEVAEKRAEDEKKMADVMAEHRDPSDTSGRLSRGDF